MKDDRVYLQHIRDALQDIAGYCGSDHQAFLGDLSFQFFCTMPACGRISDHVDELGRVHVVDV